jgi:hypothetical protein
VVTALVNALVQGWVTRVDRALVPVVATEAVQKAAVFFVLSKDVADQ